METRINIYREKWHLITSTSNAIMEGLLMCDDVTQGRNLFYWIRMKKRSQNRRWFNRNLITRREGIGSLGCSWEQFKKTLFMICYTLFTLWWWKHPRCAHNSNTKNLYLFETSISPAPVIFRTFFISEEDSKIIKFCSNLLRNKRMIN